MVKEKGFKVMNCTENVERKAVSGNSILMLSLVCRSSKKAWLGITKLQKLAFLMEYFLSQRNVRAFGYKFFMYDHGPISKGVYDDFEMLLDQQLIVDSEAGIQMSPLGNSIVEQLDHLIPTEIENIMESIVNKFAFLKTDELVKSVHGMMINLPSGERIRVHDLQKGCTVLPESTKKNFKISRSSIETFKILSDESLIEAIREERKGSVSYPYQPLS